MADRKRPRAAAFTPDPAQLALAPEISGNTLNGLGETTPRRPTPIYWHDPCPSSKHSGLLSLFFCRRIWLILV